MVTHGLSNAGGVAVRYGIGGFRGDIPGGKAGAAGGQDQVDLTAIGQPDELCLQGLCLIGQDHGLLHLIACSGEHLHDQGAALVLTLTPAALVGKGDDSSAQGRIFRRGQQGHLVPHVDLAALQHPGKHALPGHDALAGLLLDDAVVVALFADLGHFQHHVPDGEAAGHGQIAEIVALHHQILAKGTVVHPDLLAEVLDLFSTQQADLTVPVPAVGIGLNTPFRGQACAFHFGLDRAPLRAGADRQKFSHRFILQFGTYPGSRGCPVSIQNDVPGAFPRWWYGWQSAAPRQTRHCAAGLSGHIRPHWQGRGAESPDWSAAPGCRRRRTCRGQRQ